MTVKAAHGNDTELAIARNRAALDQARAAGLLRGPRTDKVGGRFNRALLDKARARTRVTSDTELLELALVRLALDDDFGRKALKRKGRVPAGIELEI
ncbi:MAG: hypothetical protein SFV19_01230 [Rhodospirillaceae bacterium]|nr:hypothetical protein [Rhodospirillaceae bacterium]